MQVCDLKNYGKLFAGKPSAMVEMKVGTMLMGELGATKVPKFLAKMPLNTRRWKRKKFKAFKERDIENREFIDGIYDSLAMFDTMVGVLGREKALEVYSKVAPKATEMMLEDHIPSAEDFLSFPDPVKALKDYVLDFFQLNQDGGVMRYDVVTNTDSDLCVVLSDCAYSAVAMEAGCPEVFSIASRGDDLFFGRLADSLGWEWIRESTLCRGQDRCEYRFRRR